MRLLREFMSYLQCGENGVKRVAYQEKITTQKRSEKSIACQKNFTVSAKKC